MKFSATKLSNQEVEVIGSVVGYQFNRESMGKRTVHTSVVTDEFDHNKGRIIWKNRRVEVVRKFPESSAKCLLDMWVTTKELGWGQL